LKQAIVVRTLALRRVLPEVFAAGSYEAIIAEGPMADHVVAFLRRHNDGVVLIAVPRLPTSLLAAADRLSLEAAAWRDTTLRFSESISLMNVLDPKSPPLVGRNVAVHQLLSRVPIAVFSTQLP
jgi:maltooligosyltrehalose synthase